jgi:hypothetical protein
MKISKIFPCICLTVLFITGLTPAAQAALVQSTWQPVTLQGNTNPGDTSGILPFANLLRVKSDGTIVPFVLPPNQALVITYVHLGIGAINTSLGTNVDLRIGPFYSRPLMMTNGNAVFIDGSDPGFRINFQGFNDPRYNYFYAVDLQNNSIIPGSISVRLVGYLVPNP